MKALHYLILYILFLSSCDKFDWHNPYDPECPKELFTPSSPGAAMEGNSVKLTWTQQNDDISGFALFRSAEGESISNLTQTQKSTTQYIDASITPGKKYTYYIVAVAGTNKSDTVKADIIPVIPVTIITGSITELAATSAKVSGNITNAGGGTVTSRGICWSTTPNPTVNNSKTTEGTGAGEFTSTLTNLLAGTTYYARAYGENSRGISYGSEITFTTLGPPKLTTTAVSNITATTATSGGTIISDGGSPITAKGVVWSASPNPTIDLATKTNDGNGLNNFTSSLINLTGNTKYYIRSYATNIIGTSYGDEVIFTTSTPVPVIEESLKQGLVAYYPFNGNANDESGNENNGTIVGAALSTDRFGNPNKSYLFDENISASISGNADNFPSANSPRSISFWYNSKNIGSGKSYQILGYGGNACGSSFIMNFENNDIGQNFLGKYEVQGHCLAFRTFAEYPLPANNKWHNITVTYNGSVLRFYNNGILVFVSNTILMNTYVINRKFVFGREVNENGTAPYFSSAYFGFSGNLDDIRIYNRALTQEEITYLANN